MFKVLLLDTSGRTFSKLTAGMQADNQVKLYQAQSGFEAFDILAKKAFDLVVADEQLTDMSGLEFARQLVARNPLVNCALVSSMRDAEFHENSEGLGILAKLPPEPDENHAGELIQNLESISRL